MVFMYILKMCWVFFLVIFKDVFIFRGKEFKLFNMYVIMGLLEFCFNIWIFDYGVIIFIFFFYEYLYVFLFNYVYLILLYLYVKKIVIKKRKISFLI